MQQPVLNKQVTCNTWETFHWVEHFLKWMNGYGRGLTHSVQKTKSSNVALAYSSWLAEAICFIFFQLTYVLLDIGIQELFPELSKVCTNSIQELQISSSYYCSLVIATFFLLFSCNKFKYLVENMYFTNALKSLKFGLLTFLIIRSLQICFGPFTWHAVRVPFSTIGQSNHLPGSPCISFWLPPFYFMHFLSLGSEFCMQSSDWVSAFFLRLFSRRVSYLKFAHCNVNFHYPDKAESILCCANSI